MTTTDQAIDALNAVLTEDGRRPVRLATAADAAPVEASKPAKACPNCGADVPAGGRGRGRRFCQDSCKTAFFLRAKSQGAPALPMLLAWMETRHAKPGTREAEICRMARNELTAMARFFIDENKAAGRPPVADYVESLFNDGERYMDRTRR